MADRIAPVWVTGPAELSTVLPRVSTLVTEKPSASVKRMVPLGVAVLPAMAASAASRTLTVRLFTSLPAALRMMSAPLLLRDFTVRVSATTVPGKPLLSVEIAPWAVSVAAPVVSIWRTAKPLASL